MLSLLYGLCGLSGASVVIYIAFWTRQFGNLFGNTFYTSLLVVTTCLVAAGAGSLVLGGWADRSATRSGAPLGTFARLHWLIAALGLAVSLVLPYVGFISGLVSFYSRGGNGWYHISVLSSALRALTAMVLFGPATFLFGGALAILSGRIVSERGARPISRLALLAGTFAIGGALGLALAEFVIAPYAGARIAELVAVLFNIVTALVATRLTAFPEKIENVAQPFPAPGPNAAALTNIGIALCSAVALSLVLLWVRHLTLLLGGFRFTKSLLFVFVTLGFGTGLLLGALLLRHTRRPAQWLIAALALLVVSVLFGIGMVDIREVLAATSPLTSAFDGTANAVSLMSELWLNAKPILIETSIPAVLIGMSFALALGIVQTGDGPARVARLLASVAAGAALGLLATALVLLSRLGMQGAATVLAVLTGGAAIPFDLATRGMPGTRRVLSATATLIASLAVSAVAIGLWVLLPSGDIITRATVQQSQDERLLALSEGPGELVAVTESTGAGRELVTDDHSTSASNPLGRRSMRALVHIPLALLDRPERVLVIGFGIGHTAHAAALHPSVQRVDVVEPSAQVLSDASYLKDANKDVLSDRKTSVFVNDGRQHLRMQSPATYDVIAVGSEPLTLDRSAALYSREFYELARTRLKPGGYLSRWLPLYQVAPATLLGMIRAFVDVFPQSVLLGATDQELLLLGVNASTGPTLDPDRLAAKLTAPPALTADLETVDLANVQEFVMTLMASSQKLTAATRQNRAASDDRPAQEFAARSRVTSIYLAGMPGDLADLSGMSTWCPACFVGGAPAPALAGLNAASPMLQALYAQALPPERGAGSPTDPVTLQLIKENQFLQNVIAQHVARRNARGVALATDNKLDEAITEFRGALRLNPSDPVTHWNLGRALVSRGQPRDAVDELRRAVELDPSGGPAHYDLASTLLDLDQVDAAIDEFRATLVVMPNSVEAHNNLGIALGRKGRLSEAIGEFQQALKINPESGEARHNLDAALMAARAAR